MKITTRKLRLMSACKDAIDWVKEQKETDARKLIRLAMKIDRFADCNWFVAKVMNHEQQIKYAIYAANLVIDIYEKKYPDDNRPRKAINAAKAYLKTRDKDAAAAAAAAAAAEAAAEAAAAEAAYAAYAAAEAAYAADAADAAYAADAAADAADAADSDRAEIQRKCINYALRLLKDKL